MKYYLQHHQNQRKITTLVENKSVYHSDFADLNIFETHEVAEKVGLFFETPIIASMIQGKKIMHLQGREAFDFLPGESVIMPANSEMIIDFPEASQNKPTQCLALGIDPEKIADVALRFNQEVKIDKESDWSLTDDTKYLIHNAAINELVKRMIQTFVEQNQSREMLLDIMIQELIVRLLQSQARLHILEKKLPEFSDTRISHVIQFIQKNLTDKKLNVNQLAEKACMSPSHFHKKFKNTLGISPIDYINAEKLKFAKKLMKSKKNLQIGEIAYLSGFNSVSYFNRQFKKMELISPSKFMESLED